MSSKIFENDYYRIEIRDDIMYASYKKEIIITLPFAKEMVANRLAFQERENYGSIAMVQYFKAKYVNKAARKYLSEEGAKGIKASAFIAKTLATKTLLKIFLLVENPKLPIRVFEDETSAVAWIKDFVGK